MTKKVHPARVLHTIFLFIVGFSLFRSLLSLAENEHWNYIVHSSKCILCMIECGVIDTMFV